MALPLHVVITGGAGFLGARLAGTVLDRGSLSVAGAPARPVTRLTLLDQVIPPEPVIKDRRVAVWHGDLAAELDADRPGPLVDADVVFHLAAAVSAECERDFDLGLHANLTGTAG